MTGVIKTDQLQGAQSTTITIPTGNKITITDSAVIGTIDATTVRGTTTFTDSAVFSGVVNTTTVQGEGTSTTNLKQGLQKAWFRIDNMTLVDSFNGSSITDNQAGDATANVTSAMGNILYCVTHSPDESAYSDGSHRVVEGIKATAARTASLYRCRFGYSPYNNNFVPYDDTDISMCWTGDLA